MNVDDIELKPCPFCGGKAELGDGRGHNWDISCIECGASSEQTLIRSEIIAAWNKRAPAPTQQDRE